MFYLVAGVTSQIRGGSLFMGGGGNFKGATFLATHRKMYKEPAKLELLSVSGIIMSIFNLVCVGGTFLALKPKLARI